MTPVLEANCATVGCPRRARPEYAPHCKECGRKLQIAAEAAAKEKARLRGRVVKITDHRQLEDRLRELGFNLQFAGRHIKVTDGMGEVVTVLSVTPSDRRAVENAIHDVRRRTGIDVRKV